MKEKIGNIKENALLEINNAKDAKESVEIAKKVLG